MLHNSAIPLLLTSHAPRDNSRIAEEKQATESFLNSASERLPPSSKRTVSRRFFFASRIAESPLDPMSACLRDSVTRFVRTSSLANAVAPPSPNGLLSSHSSDSLSVHPDFANASVPSGPIVLCCKLSARRVSPVHDRLRNWTPRSPPPVLSRHTLAKRSHFRFPMIFQPSSPRPFNPRCNSDRVGRQTESESDRNPSASRLLSARSSEHSLEYRETSPVHERAWLPKLLQGI